MTDISLRRVMAVGGRIAFAMDLESGIVNHDAGTVIILVGLTSIDADLVVRRFDELLIGAARSNLAKGVCPELRREWQKYVLWCADRNG